MPYWTNAAMTIFPDETSLPSYLRPDQILEPEALPLQVHLLTLETADLRQRMQFLAAALAEIASWLQMPRPWTDE